MHADMDAFYASVEQRGLDLGREEGLALDALQRHVVDGVAARLQHDHLDLGVRRERIRVVDPYELPTFFKALREEIKAHEPSVVVTTRPCVLSSDFERLNPLEVIEEKCNGCARCLDLGCPAIGVTRREQQTRASGNVVELAFVTIDAATCTGCDLCAKACGQDAIVPRAAALAH